MEGSVRKRFLIQVGAVAAVILAAAFVTSSVMAQTAQTAPPERWLHVRVDKTGGDGETVRVNVPLSLAEKVLPAINSREFRDGRLRLGNRDFDRVDLRAILAAIKETRDGEFVTVESNREKVRVSKSQGYLLVKVEEQKGKQTKADIKIPMSVVEALLSGASDELNLVAGIRALAAHGDAVLVEVRDGNESVRIWVDMKNTAE